MKNHVGQMVTEGGRIPNLPVDPVRQQCKWPIVPKRIPRIGLAVIIFRKRFTDSGLRVHRSVLLQQVVIIKDKLPEKRRQIQKKGEQNQKQKMLLLHAFPGSPLGFHVPVMLPSPYLLIYPAGRIEDGGWRMED